MTLNRALFDRDPLTFTIPNDGVSKVGTPTTDRQWQVLRYELESFVCEGKYQTSLQRILTSYLGNTDKATQPAAWLSGFYGSGKSHLARVLEHLWRNTIFPDGAAARSVVPTLPDEIARALIELDTYGRRLAVAPWSAAGSLDTSASDDLHHAILAIVFEAAGLPTKADAAQVVLWLRSEGLAEAVQSRLAVAGRALRDEARTYNLSVPLAEAIIAERPGIAASPPELLQRLKTQFAVGALSTADTVRLLRATLEDQGGGSIPPTLLVVDEVQQYINDNTQRALDVQGLAQALTSQFDGRVLLVATGQQELMANPELQKIQDRFSLKAHLENQDVDEVVRRVLLQKRPAQITLLSDTLVRSAGEIGRELQGSKLQHRAPDDEQLTRDYPLLPSRRRFWEAVLRAADQGGRAGQLRSQLRVVHEANRHVGEEPVGTVVGADYLYEQKSSDMYAAGRLSRDVQKLIADQPGQGEDGVLRGRILAVLHLISLLPSEGPADTGLRPTAANVADLLVRDLDTDGGRLRQQVPFLLETMARHGIVQQDGDQFGIQTEEGRVWADDYRGKRAALVGDTAEIAAVRDHELRLSVEQLMPRGVPQGSSKANRRLDLHFTDDSPPIGDKIPVWVRSEWHGLGRRQFADQTRAAGDDSPLVCVYLPRLRSEELREALLDLRAAELVLQTRPTPTTAEGEQAKRAMETRLRGAQARLATVVEDIVANATIELAGGATPDGSTVADRLRNGAARAVTRLFGEFGPADDTRWPKVIERLKDGNDQPLEVVGYLGPVDQQPAVAKVLTEIGTAGVTGKALLERFGGRPYGWDTDVLRAALGTLLANGTITAENNAQPLDTRGLLTLSSRIGSVRFRRETVPITRLETIRARSIASRVLDRQMPAGESAEISARLALQDLRARADRIAGPAPLPEMPLPANLNELGTASGNELVKRFVGAAAQIEEFSEHLDALERRRTERQPQLDLGRQLATALTAVTSAKEPIDGLRSLEASRELLAVDDHVGPLVRDLAECARDALTAAIDAYEDARSAAVAALTAEPRWTGLTEPERERLLGQHRLLPESRPQLDTPTAVLAALQARPLAQWSDRRDALPARATQCLHAAIRLSTPEATSVGLPGGPIGSAADLTTYLDGLRARLEAALAEHGTIVVRGS